MADFDTGGAGNGPSPVKWCNGFVSFRWDYAVSVSGVFSWWVGCELRLAHPSRSGRWSEMRLGFAASGSHCGGLVQNASQSRGFSRIQANSRKLRRILDQVPGKTPFPPGTQTHFGPAERNRGATWRGCGSPPAFEREVITVKTAPSRRAPPPPRRGGGLPRPRRPQRLFPRLRVCKTPPWCARWDSNPHV